MSVIGSNILAGASGQGGGYNLTRSLRFRSSASAYLNRTFSSGNRQTWTYSTWVKRGSLGTSPMLLQSLGAGGFGVEGFIDFSSDNLRFRFDYNGGSQWQLVTTAVYRDPSAWYHIVVVADTTNATSGDRLRIYVNGTRVTSFSTANYPSQNANGTLNQAYAHALCARTAPSDYFDGYLTEVNFIDGQALTPSSFGEYSTTTGVWQPKKYSGTYGTNGFYLPFSDNTSTTTLGADSSGNGNNWTTNNISLTAGATYDSMTDVPTLTSATASNFAVLNPIQKSSSVTVSQANLYGVSSAGNQTLPATIYANSGKWYAEFTCVTAGLEDMLGIITDTFNFGASFYQSNQLLVARSSGDIFYSSAATFGGPTWTSGDIIQIKLDLDNQTVGWAKNGGSYTTATITSYDGHTAGKNWTFAIKNGVSGGNGNFYYNANFGQRPFAYTPPTGYVALNTFNLPTPTIGATASSQANKYFDATTYTGNGSSGKAVTNSGSFSPDFVWIKDRTSANYHGLFDRLRGAGYALYSNGTFTESAFNAQTLQSLDASGFTVGTNGDFNTNNNAYVGWQWKANGTGVTNTAGSITSTVSANTTSGFSVVTYTGNGSAGATVGHGLGVAPRMLIIKARNGSGYSWKVYHGSLGSGSHLELESTGAAQGGIWNSTNPSSTVFTLGTNAGVNENGKNYVCYAFADVTGYAKLGSYTGNGSSDGVFVHCGFRPKFIMTKCTTDAGTNWNIKDTTREPSNASTQYLVPNSSGAEGSGSTWSMDILSNGFKMRTADSLLNTNGSTYIFAAFAEVPTKFALAR